MNGSALTRRQPTGIPAGGQFAPEHKAEPASTLQSPQEFVDEFEAGINALGALQATQARAQVAASLDIQEAAHFRVDIKHPATGTLGPLYYTPQAQDVEEFKAMAVQQIVTEKAVVEVLPGGESYQPREVSATVTDGHLDSLYIALNETGVEGSIELDHDYSTGQTTVLEDGDQVSDVRAQRYIEMIAADSNTSVEALWVLIRRRMIRNPACDAHH